MDKPYVTGDWDGKYKQWKEDRKKRELTGFQVKQSSFPQTIAEEVKEIEEKAFDYITEPKHLKILKIIALLIPLLIIGYLIYSNFIVSKQFNYFYDIGAQGEQYLTPLTRVSAAVTENSTYRNLTSGLVYFDVPIPRGAEKVDIQIRFKDNFPEVKTMSLGAKDQEVWHYNYHSIYNPSLNNLSQFPRRGNVYLINPELYLVNPQELIYERDIIVAADKKYTPLPNIVSDYEGESTVINTSLRGGHTAFIYIEGDLILEVKKQDINWYEDSDELEVSLYDLENNLISNMTIVDDGITNISNKNVSVIQNGTLQANNLKEGVYKIEFSDFDGLIREIKINTNKIVFTKLYLADSTVYNLQRKSSLIYTEAKRNENLELLTYHREGIQDITYLENGKNKSFNFSQEDKPLYLDLAQGTYEFKIPNNDLVLSGTSYLAFSKKNYFEPFKQKVVPIKNDIKWLKENVDYLITDYEVPASDSGWFIAEGEFDIKEEKLFIKNNKLNFVLNTPHLSQDGFQNNTIPIDWINITVHKPGVLK